MTRQPFTAPCHVRRINSSSKGILSKAIKLRIATEHVAASVHLAIDRETEKRVGAITATRTVHRGKFAVELIAMHKESA